MKEPGVKESGVKQPGVKQPGVKQPGVKESGVTATPFLDIGVRECDDVHAVIRRGYWLCAQPAAGQMPGRGLGRDHQHRVAYSQHVLDQQSLKRRSTPDELAAVVSFLAGREPRTRPARQSKSTVGG